MAERKTIRLWPRPVKSRAEKEKEDLSKLKSELGLCLINRIDQHVPQKRGSGILVGDLVVYEGNPPHHYLITSDKVITDFGEFMKSYVLEFGNSAKSSKFRKIPLHEIAASLQPSRPLGNTSGIIFICLESKRVGQLKRRLIRVAVDDLQNYENFYCLFVDVSPQDFVVKCLRIKHNGSGKYVVEEDGSSYTTYESLKNNPGYRPRGGTILKEVQGEFKCVGMLDFTDDEAKILSPVFFSFIFPRIGVTDNRALAIAHFRDSDQQDRNNPQQGQGKPGKGEGEPPPREPERGGGGQLQHQGNLAKNGSHEGTQQEGKEEENIKKPGNKNKTGGEKEQQPEQGEGRGEEEGAVGGAQSCSKQGKMPLNHFATGIENGVPAFKKGGQEEHLSQSNQGERDVQCATETENDRTASLNGMVVEEKQNRGGNSTVNNQHLLQSNQGIGSFDITIDPAEISLKGGGPCHFLFIPDLPSDIFSGTAKFFGLLGPPVKLKGVKDEADCLVGRGIPSAEKEGWVTVGVRGKNDKTRKYINLGQARIYYFDERKRLLKEMVENVERCHEFFETWKTAYEGHSTASRVTKTESPSSGSMDSDNPLHSLQGLMLLVYTAAETDAQQFIELIFNSSAGRVVFNAYRCNSPLPEDVARAFGHEDTAQYLESISKRFSEDLSINEEDLQASHILELAEAVKNQSNYKVNYNQEAITASDEITNVASHLQDGTATGHGAVEYDEYKKVNIKNGQVLERQFQKPPRIFESLFGLDYNGGSVSAELETSEISLSDPEVTQVVEGIFPSSGHVKGGFPLQLTTESDKTGVARFDEVGDVLSVKTNCYPFSGFIPELPKPLPTPEQAARTKPSPHTPSQESGDDIDYKVKSGYVLVIHNFIFSKRQDSARHGSEQDVKNLISLFDDFNFKTRMVEIFTQSQMVDILNETAEKDFSRYDCFLCIIFSHGLKDGIYGTDEEVIKIEAVTSFFRRDACPSLEGKPKIFLIQACRGTQQDRVPIESDSEPVPYASSSLPADADFLICFASALSSWFISTVVAIFKEYAEREHLMDMMLRVNDRLAQFYSKGGLKQIPCQICTLRRKVHLSPRYNTS